MGVAAQTLAPGLWGSPEDAERSAAPLTLSAKHKFSGATQWLLSINLSLKPPQSLVSQRLCFLWGCSRRSMLPHRGQLSLLVTERACGIDPDMLRPPLFPVTLTCNLLTLSVHNTLNSRVAFNAPGRFAAAATVVFGRHPQHLHIKCMWMTMVLFAALFWWILKKDILIMTERKRKRGRSLFVSKLWTSEVKLACHQLPLGGHCAEVEGFKKLKTEWPESHPEFVRSGKNLEKNHLWHCRWGYLEWHHKRRKLLHLFLNKDFKKRMFSSLGSAKKEKGKLQILFRFSQIVANTVFMLFCWTHRLLIWFLDITLFTHLPIRSLYLATRLTHRRACSSPLFESWIKTLHVAG